MTRSEFDLPLRESMHRHKRHDKDINRGHESHRKRKAGRSLRLARRHKQEIKPC